MASNYTDAESNRRTQMGWQPGARDGTGEEPAPDLPGSPEGADGGLGASAPSTGLPSAHSPSPRGFADGGEWDTCPPSASLAAALQAVSGREWRCPVADHDQLFGLLRQWQALESWAAAAKLGVLRALIREDDQPLSGGYHGDLPDGWSKPLTHEVALALAMPPQSAEKLMWTAWDLHARLPETGALLANGGITFPKARAVAESLASLTDDEAAKADAMIAPELRGKTFGQAEKLAVQAAVTIDPESATRRREDAERNRARIALRRDPSGATSLSGYDLPTDETLAAHAHVCARAADYKDCGGFPGVRMDQLRAMAYLDLMNGITAEARIAAGQPAAGLGAPNEYGPDPDPSPTDSSSTGSSPADPSSPDPGPDDPGPDDPGPDDGSPDRGEPGGGGSPVPPAPQSPLPARAPQPPRPADLIIPLSTLLGLAKRPGEGHGLGPLDPGLCRSLAAIAAHSPHTTLCVTVTNPEGIAIGHGCARPARRGRPEHEHHARNEDHARTAAQGHSPPDPPDPLAALPARINLTIQAAHLPELTKATAEPGTWSFVPAAGSVPPDGYGTWQLTLPGGKLLLVKLDQVPTFGCDHRHESHAYQPNDTLRHLVQIRDYECTYPTCSRHARDSDFEHARPYDQGGRTCSCNAGARSRQCHRVKQSPGWNVAQPAPGWHQWITPSGRRYTQGPKRYPA
jgi:Domain of unknown function (DUF222)